MPRKTHLMPALSTAAATGVKPRAIGNAALDLTAANNQCTCCDRRLTGKFAWLELDQRTNTYHDFGGVPPEQSQGWFPFGLTCAARAIARAESAS